MKNRRNGGFFVYFKGLVTPFHLSGKRRIDFRWTGM